MSAANTAERRAALSDLRLIPELGLRLWSERVSEPEWRWCKYCFQKAPTFIFREGEIGDARPKLVLRGCWQCGSGLEAVDAQ